MTDGPSLNCAKSGIPPNCVTAISFSSPVFNEAQLGTRLHDWRSVPGWKEYNGSITCESLLSGAGAVVFVL
jgi:hypothetical protein